MEFNEKLYQLRKNKGLTQEELAEALCVSRAAVSKWESGRGYPNIEALKDISVFFSVSIDDLLSGEKIILIAEKENKSNIRNLCDLFFGITDIFSFALVLLPLYPDTVNGFIYSVNLLQYAETSDINRLVYWIVYLLLIVTGIVNIILSKMKHGRKLKVVTGISLAVNIFAVFFLALTREAYALVIVFFLLMIKCALVLRKSKEK